MAARQTVQQPTFHQISTIWEKSATDRGCRVQTLVQCAAGLQGLSFAFKALPACLDPFVCPASQEVLAVEEVVTCVRGGDIEDNFGFRPAGSIFRLSTPAS